jgi:hypothetical protein
MCSTITNYKNNNLNKCFKENHLFILMVEQDNNSQIKPVLNEGKSVHIEGDKSFFVSKGAIDRLKRDLKNNDTEKLEKNDYFKEDWTYQIISQSELEIKIKLINKIDLESNNKPRVLNCDERRQLLKDKMKKLRNSNSVKKSKVEVPKDLLKEYLSLKKYKLKVDLLDPGVVLSNPDEYKNTVHTMVQSFGMFKGHNNPVINYYKSLAKHLDLPTTYIGDKNDIQTQNILKQVEQTINNKDLLKQMKEKLEMQTKEEIEMHPKTNEDIKIKASATTNFVEQLQRERQILVENEVDEEMKKIYESLGIIDN